MLLKSTNERIDGYCMLSTLNQSFIMELEEIKAGNLVMYKNQICRIIGFTCKDKIYLRKIQVEIQYLNNMLGYGFTDIDEVEPIELTKEWLLKFDFVQDGNHLDYNGFCFIVKRDGVSLWSNPKPEYPIKYVHQFQNFYCGQTGRLLVCA